MPTGWIKRDRIQEYDVEDEQRRHDALASRRSKEARNVRWAGTAGNPASQVSKDYQARVFADGGVVEARKCLQSAIYNLMV